MGKREISDDELRLLMESRAELLALRKQRAEQQRTRAEADVSTLDSIDTLLNSWGPMVMLVGGATVLASSGLAAVWGFGELAAAMMAAAGKIGVIAGGAATLRTMAKKHVTKKKKEKLAELSQDMAPPLLPAVDDVDEQD